MAVTKAETTLAIPRSLMREAMLAVSSSAFWVVLPTVV